MFKLRLSLFWCYNFINKHIKIKIKSDAESSGALDLHLSGSVSLFLDESRLVATLWNFGESTYTRGIAKILKSSSVVDRAIWILAVVACSVMLLSHSAYLFSGYMQHGYVTVMKQKPYDSPSDRPVSSFCACRYGFC